jgi:hypothetical protein
VTAETFAWTALGLPEAGFQQTRPLSGRSAMIPASVWFLV